MRESYERNSMEDGKQKCFVATNSISKWMPVLSCAQPGEYTYKNISCKMEKHDPTFDYIKFL